MADVALGMDMAQLQAAIEAGEIGPGVSASPLLVARAEGWYSLWRHSGRRNSGWRLVGFYANRERAEKAARKIRFRQGGLCILGPDLRPVLREWAPRLRTRW